MTFEEAAAILGPDICADIDANVRRAKPLTDAQITVLVGLLRKEPTVVADSDAA